MARIPGQESRHPAKACLSSVSRPESASRGTKDFPRRYLRPSVPSARFCYEPLSAEEEEEEDQSLFKRKEKLVFIKGHHKHNKKTCIRKNVTLVQSLEPARELQFSIYKGCLEIRKSEEDVSGCLV